LGVDKLLFGAGKNDDNMLIAGCQKINYGFQQKHPRIN